jgi:hypothetical protein
MPDDENDQHHEQHENQESDQRNRHGKSVATRVVAFIGCARCDGEGHELAFARFERPIEAGEHTFEWWALCPTTGEPILMEIAVTP